MVRLRMLEGEALRALFLTWDGSQQSYLESLFFPIFGGLRTRGIDVQVLQLTWAAEAQLERARAAAAERGIELTTRRIPEPLRKLALPAVGLYGAAEAVRLVRGQGCDALFPRSLIPMTMALLAQRLLPGVTLLFDADGFMADERVEFGGWSPNGASYRVLRRAEASGVRRARAVICRTEAARRTLVERAGTPAVESKIFVVPNPKDSAVFAPVGVEERQQVRSRHAVAPDAPWVVYVGSLGPQYCPELMLDTFAHILRARPDARFSCFTFQTEVWDALLSRRPELKAAVQTGRLAPDEVAPVLAACDLGLAPRRESFSQLGISPIKVAEYLLCGTPVAATRVGDLSDQAAGSAAVLLVDPQLVGAAASIAHWFVAVVLPARDALRQQARELGLRWFELSRGVDAYERALRFGMSRVRS